MNLENVQVELERLLALVQGWIAGEKIPSIERDLALDKLKMLYEELRFVRSEPVAAAVRPQPAPAPAAAEPEPPTLEVIDLDEVLLSEEPFVREEPVAAQSAVGERVEPESVSEPKPAEATAEPEPEPEPSAGEPVAAADETPASVSGKEASRLQHSLFDLSEIPVHRRDTRRVLMSLYGESPVRRSNKLRTKPQPEFKSRPEPDPIEMIEEIPLVSFPAAESEPVPAPVAEEIPVREEPQPAAEEPVAAALSEPSEPEPESVPEESAFEPGQSGPASEEPSAEEEAEDDFGEVTFSEEPVETEPVRQEPVSESVPVLGEVIGADRLTLADALAPQRSERGTVAAGSIDSLRSAIGINDRFLLIGELFGGDAELYERTIDALDGMETLDDCLIYAAENHTWNPNSDGVKLLFELLERKYGEC